MVRKFAIAAGLVTLLSGSACVDVIDGSWCAGSGQQLSIKGPAITLPSQITIHGEHHLHAFSYWPLAGAPDVGQMIYMHLEDDGQLSLYHVKDGNPGEAETWKRCDISS
jgi:hypothetical protein